MGDPGIELEPRVGVRPRSSAQHRRHSSKEEADAGVDRYQARATVHELRLWHGRALVGIVPAVEATGSPREAPGRSTQEVESLLVGTEDLVERVLSQLFRVGIRGDRSELLAFGQQGLIEAAHRFDPEVGGDFRRFAYFRVRGAMLDGLRKMNNWSRRGYERVALLRTLNDTSAGFDEVDPAGCSATEAAQRLRSHMASMVTAMTMGVFAEHVVQNGGTAVALDKKASAEDEVADQQMQQIVRAAMGSLPPPEDEVVRRYYVEGERMDDIAADLGYSKSWVSRVHTRALKRLGPRLRSLGRD